MSLAGLATRSKPAFCETRQRLLACPFCSHNSSDSEYMMGQLQEYGFK